MTQTNTPPEEPQAPVVFGSTITILFSDIRGFTEFTDEYGDEAAYRMLQHHNSLVKEQIELYGGHIVKTLGDSFMVSFDAARGAVACAVGIQRAIEQYNRVQQGPKIEIGVGINTREPVREAEDLFGGAVNLASRICAASGPGRILVSETVRQVVGRTQGSEWIDRGFFDIKGFQEPQHLLEVDWVRAEAVRAPQVALPSGIPGAEAVSPSVAVYAPVNRRPRPLLAAAVVAVLLVAGGLIGVIVQSGQENRASVLGADSAGTTQGDNGPQVGSTVRLLHSDDFADPAKGLFLDKQRGITRGMLGGDTPFEFVWEYGYANKSLEVRLNSPSPAPNPGTQGRRFYHGAAETDKILSGDFAVEVRARATKSVEQATYSIDYVLSGEDRYQFVVAPSVQRHGISLGPQHRNFMSNDRNSTISRGGEENQLRMEVRGDTMAIFVNGQELDKGRHDGLRRRGGTVELVAGMSGPPEDGEVAVRFTDFKVYALASP